MFNKRDKHWPKYAKNWKWLGYPRLVAQANCAVGNHIPAGMTDVEGNILEVICQECATELSETDWNRFWKG
jgi:hypothetical protein